MGCHLALKPPPVEAAEGCDLLILLFENQKIAASFHSAAPTDYPVSIRLIRHPPVGAAEGCDPLISLFENQKIAASFHSAAPTDYPVSIRLDPTHPL
jgi:hypothetical protein